MKPQLQGLYGITDSQLLATTEQLLEAVEAALQGGMKILQYRDKSSDQAKRLEQVSALVSLCANYHCPLLINDDVALAKASGAQGVHLGQTDGSLAEARATLGDDAIIGITCHDQLSLAQQAQQGGADYVAFGAFFPSSTKPGASAAPMALLDQAKQQLHCPVVAIGGITMDNAAQLISRGADMLAVVSGIFAAEDIQQRALAFSQQFPDNR